MHRLSRATFTALLAASLTFAMACGNDPSPEPDAFSDTDGSDGGEDAPDTMIDRNGLPSETTSTSIEIAFSSDAANATFECALDDSAFEPCTSPTSYGDLSLGDHIFQVYAIDSEGRQDLSPALFEWTITAEQATVPDTILLDTPEELVAEAEVTFEFEGAPVDETSGFECRVGDSDWEDCTSPHSVSVDPGDYVFEVRALATDGTPDPTPAQFEWRRAADEFEASGPDLVSEPSATFTFLGRFDDTFECQVDAGGWEPCESPYTVEGLSEGTHTFEVRRTRVPEEVITLSFEVDLTAPSTTLTPPTNPGSNVTFEFSSDDSEATFECRLDPNEPNWQDCSTPLDYTSLGANSYTFEVRAVDLAGNVDPTPESFSWDVTTAWRSVAVLGSTGCGIRESGEMWCWGARRDGNTPVFHEARQEGTVSNWDSLAIAADHRCALRTDGSLWCWGDNDSGQLGVGSTSYKFVPARVGSSTNWVDVKPSGESSFGSDTCATCGLRSDGTLWCWGSADYGKLGNGAESGSETSPVQVGTDTDWVELGTAQDAACAIKQDGTLWCWGRNRNGAVGDGTTTDRATPTRIGADSDWATISTARDDFFCAVKTTGTLWCWGDVPRMSDATSPSQVGSDTDWVQAQGGDQIACATKADQSLHCWGSDRDGRLGTGTFSSESMPTPVAPSGSKWQTTAHDEDFTCGIQDDGTLWCWGLNMKGQLGIGVVGSSISSPSAVSPNVSWNSVSTGDQHSCGIQSDNSLWCWGHNSAGQVDGEVSGFRTYIYDKPARVDPATDWAQVSAGGQSTCAVKNDGTLWCWGSNGLGQLGQGDTADYVGVQQVTSDTDWASVSVSPAGLDISRRGFVCALKTDGTLWCWGDNTYSQLGISATDVFTPTQIGSASDWVDVNAGTDGTCAINSTGQLYCWGEDRYDRLGNGTQGDISTPTQIGSMTNWSDVILGFSSSCGLLSSGEIQCAGLNEDGQLGDGTTTNSQTFVTAGAAMDWTDVAVGARFAQIFNGDPSWPGYGCGIRTNGTLWCWGEGEPNADKSSDPTVPQRLGWSTNWVDVVAGTSHQCALRSDDSLWCWGNGDDGRVGAGLWRSATPLRATDASQ